MGPLCLLHYQVLPQSSAPHILGQGSSATPGLALVGPGVAVAAPAEDIVSKHCQPPGSAISAGMQSAQAVGVLLYPPRF